MSWMIKNAESFLNNLDQTATGALGATPQKSSNETSSGGYKNSADSPLRIPASKSLYSLSATEIAQTANIKRTPSDHAINTNAQKSRSQPSTGRVRTDADDEKLFEFLNSPSSSNGEARKKRSGSGTGSGRHSRQSSTSSNVSTRSAKADGPVNANPATPSSKEKSTGNDFLFALTLLTLSYYSKVMFCESDEADFAEPDLNDSPASSETVEISEPLGPEVSRGVGSEIIIGDQDPQQQLSSLQLENKLLKNEVSSLNEEMVAALGRVKKAQEDTKRLQGELRKKETQESGTDNIVRQLRSREEDLAEELNAKNSQLAVLRVRLQEADQEIKSKTQQVNDLNGERNRILRDHSDSSGIHSQALDSLKLKLQEAEVEVKREKESYKKLQVEYMQRQEKLEGDQKNMAESITTAQQKFADEKAHSSALSQQLQTARHSMEEAKNELADYKQKAARILSSKEKLITSLKAGSTNSEGETVSIEQTELLHERDMLKEEIQQANAKIEQLRQEVQDLEALQQSETESSQDHMRDLEDNLAQQRQQIQDMETDLAKKSEQLRYAEDENYKQKINLTTKIKERDDEIQRLRNQLVAKTAGSASQAELENRLRTLTESLIQKQTMLEALGTEKNSLYLQLERMEKTQRESMQARGDSGHTAVQIGSTHDDDEGARQRTLPHFMKELPSDASVTRNVKRAANSLDKLSVRMGVFLRRYPSLDFSLSATCLHCVYTRWVSIERVQSAKGSAKLL
ncbi:putative golgin subfamily A member 5 [Apostichopus japonicus]|uniref:Putative golgin subfamily A member 5 n=1 Tax=Stichopus japonicus TaxID=307972 RepID=A0A2G8KC97_STIJA|nr:putative golgin subfamily A member 5 [Apostichopus japonicus]